MSKDARVIKYIYIIYYLECGPSVGSYNPKELRHIPGLPTSNDTRFKEQKVLNDKIGLDISCTGQQSSVTNTPHNSRLKKVKFTNNYIIDNNVCILKLYI